MIETERIEKDVQKIKSYLGKFGKFMNRQWKLSYIVFFIFAGFMYLGAFSSLMLSFDDEFTSSNTKEYTATITKIQVLPQYTIQVNEYSAALYISDSGVVIDFDALSALSVGDTIRFRVSVSASKSLGMITEQLELVALEANSTDIITIGSTNEYFKDYYASEGAVIGLSVMATVFLLFGFWFKKIYRTRTQELQEIICDSDSIFPSYSN